MEQDAVMTRGGGTLNRGHEGGRTVRWVEPRQEPRLSREEVTARGVFQVRHHVIPQQAGITQPHVKEGWSCGGEGDLPVLPLHRVAGNVREKVKKKKKRGKKRQKETISFSSLVFILDFDGGSLSPSCLVGVQVVSVHCRCRSVRSSTLRSPTTYPPPLSGNPPPSDSPCLLVSLSPCLLVSLSPCLLVSLSPCLLVSLSPCFLAW